MNIRFRMRRSLLAGAVLVASGSGVLALGATPAGASIKEVSAVGSFTTYQVMHNIFGPSLNDENPGGTTTHTFIVATPTQCKTGVNWYTVTHVTNATGHLGAPNGSTAGKKQLLAEESALATRQGCETFARSSSPPVTSTVSSHFDYYAYALDAVEPMVGSNAGGTDGSPIALSLATMKDIYLCKPTYRNWKTVTGTNAAVNGLSTQGGKTATIDRFWPQTGSGTRSVYKTMFGFTPDTTTFGTGNGSTCGTAVHTTATRPITHFTHVIGTSSVVNEENSEQGIIYDSHHTPVTGTARTAATVLKNAIFIYSTGKFQQEWNNKATYNLTAVNSITGKTGATAIGNFDGKTLMIARMFTQKTGSTKENALVFGAPLSGTFTGTTNRGNEAPNTTIVKESNEWFAHIPLSTDAPKLSKALVPGIRYIYNVADTALPTYSEAKMMIGFDNVSGGAKSSLCNGDDSAAITASGFQPLGAGATAPAATGGGYGSTGTAPAFGTTTDKDGSYCREFPGKSLPTYGTPKAWTASTFVQVT